MATRPRRSVKPSAQPTLVRTQHPPHQPHNSKTPAQRPGYHPPASPMPSHVPLTPAVYGCLWNMRGTVAGSIRPSVGPGAGGGRCPRAMLIRRARAFWRGVVMRAWCVRFGSELRGSSAPGTTAGSLPPSWAPPPARCPAPRARARLVGLACRGPPGCPVAGRWHRPRRRSCSRLRLGRPDAPPRPGCRPRPGHRDQLADLAGRDPVDHCRGRRRAGPARRAAS